MRPAMLSLLALLLLMRHHVEVSGVAVHVTEGNSGLCRMETAQMRFLSCSGSDVTEVPTIEAGLVFNVFNLDACSISAIGPNSFVNLSSSLTYLSIRSTVPINSMDENAFKNLASLTQLLVIAPSMQDKQINLSGLLRSLSSLAFLQMENVKLGDLPSEFAAGTKLATLRLINAEIVSLAPDALARLSSLTVLDLSKNQASGYASDLLRQIGSVQNLTMTDCGLTEIRVATKFSRLSKINMDRNKLSLVDLGLLSGVGSTLEELSFNNNQLGSDGLPGLETLTALRRLYLLNNPMKLIPTKMSQLEGLEILDARLTSISNIRVGDFHERSRLTALRLIEAPITLIELTAFDRLSKLAELSITLTNSPALYTSVTEMKPASWSDVVSRLPALRNLTLSGIPSSHSNLDDAIWPGLMSSQQLRRLILSFNEIQKVPDFQFAWSSIEYLNLQGNSIKELNSAGLYGLAPTAQLNLKDNSLSTLDNCSLAALKSLAGVELSGNPWRCDCSLVWLLERLRAEAGAEALKLLACAQPDSLRGRSWSDLSAKDFCPSDSTASSGTACEVRIPPTMPSPTPTTFPYPLDIRLSLDPGQEQLIVRMVVNTSGLASRFNRYVVRFGLVPEYDLSSRVQEALISVTMLTFHVDVAETHKFCVILKGPKDKAESPDNCRLFLPARSERQLTAAHISLLVVIPIIGLVLLGVLIFCLARRAKENKEAKKTAQQTNEVNNQYSQLASNEPQYQAARKPESRRFTKRSDSASNNLDGSQGSPQALQYQKFQQLQQQHHIQQAQQRMHTMSLTGGRQSEPFMRAARSTDQLTSPMMAPSMGGPGRARSQEFILDHPNLQRSRSGFNQYQDDVPPPLPARNPSRVVLPQEEEYEQMEV